MKIRSQSLMLGAIILGIAPAAFAQATAYSLQSLSFMAGCWESAGGKDSQSTEHWMKPAGGMMIGMGRTVAGGKAVDYEFMRIEQRGSDVVFLAKPKANTEETPFKLIKLETDAATFENAAHDFPQRVMYRLAKDGSLAARIEGTINGKAKGIDFPMARAACDK